MSTQLHALAATAVFLFTTALAPAASFSAWDEDEEEGEEESAEEDDAPSWLAVEGGDVHTGLGDVLRGATVLAKNGKIEAIGYDLFVPADAKRVDATGLRVYPGLVAVNASSRIPEGTSPFIEEDFVEDVHDILHRGGDPQAHAVEGEKRYVDFVDPGELDVELDVELDSEHSDLELAEAEGSALAKDLGDSYDPFSHYLVLTLATGITTVGQSKATFKLKRRGIDGVVMRDDILQTMSFSLRNPRSISGLREKFAGAAEYLRKMRDWEELKKDDDELKEPSRRGVDTTALKILSGEKRARFNVGEREALLGIARIAQEFDFRPVIFGCEEGWTIASELGRAGALVVLTPRARNEKDERLVRDGGTSIENAAILHAHGVQVAVIPSDTSINLMGIAGRDLMHLPIEAAFAVRGGLSELAALQAITLVPARVLGVNHRVGSLEVGKDCDLIVTDGDLLHYETFVQYTVVAGELVYDKNEELFFQHIRPRGGSEAADTPGDQAAEQALEQAAG